MRKNPLNRLDPLSRRRFVEKTAKAALGLSLLPATDQIMAQASGGKAKHIIYMFMSGGMTHIDTFDPKPQHENGGQTGVSPTGVPGEYLSEFMPELAKRFKDIAVVRTLMQKTADHRGASYWMRTSYQQRASIIHPCLGAWAQRLLGKSHEVLPDSVVIGGGGSHPGAGFFGPTYTPLPLGDPNAGLPNSRINDSIDQKKFDARIEALQTINQSFTSRFKTDEVEAYNQFYDDTIQVMQSDQLDVFDLNQEPQAKREKYGMNRFGQGLLLAKRLVKEGIRFVEVVKGGWDMHNNLWTAIPNNAGELDQAISALIDDLKAEGLFEETLLVLTTEFGRTPRINANAGRDHHSLCFSGMLAGGGIQGGQSYGKSDSAGHAAAEDPCEQKDFNATIATACGMSHDEVVFSPSGRPFMIAGHREDPRTKELLPEGKPIMQFFS